jgi:hypothetical protein
VHDEGALGEAGMHGRVQITGASLCLAIHRVKANVLVMDLQHRSTRGCALHTGAEHNAQRHTCVYGADCIKSGGLY